MPSRHQMAGQDAGLILRLPSDPRKVLPLRSRQGCDNHRSKSVAPGQVYSPLLGPWRRRERRSWSRCANRLGFRDPKILRPRPASELAGLQHPTSSCCMPLLADDMLCSFITPMAVATWSTVEAPTGHLSMARRSRVRSWRTAMVHRRMPAATAPPAWSFLTEYGGALLYVSVDLVPRALSSSPSQSSSTNCVALPIAPLSTAVALCSALSTKAWQARLRGACSAVLFQRWMIPRRRHLATNPHRHLIRHRWRQRSQIILPVLTMWPMSRLQLCFRSTPASMRLAACRRLGPKRGG
mmetsp:Transcript_1796/g.3949  ORF Transcript_1796/g.3949 Transcript_1796/m.3949 type:complete len:296 (-) Transcript_1796:826-1713(-)